MRKLPLCIPGLVILTCVLAFHPSYSRETIVKSRATPKLLLLVVFDQLRGDYLQRWSELYGENGFKKLMQEGRWYSNCHYPYSMTVTGAGHATLGTGCTPAQHGIVENDWYDRSTRTEAYCASMYDRYKMIPEGARSKAGKDSGGAPDRLMVPALGDVVKAATSNKGKVIGISMKDRGGVLPTGKKADICYWYDNNEGAFVTSSFYTDRLPSYMQQFNQQKYADKWFGRNWERLRTDIDYEKYSGPDDQTGEGTGTSQGRVFPHSMTGGLSKPGSKFYDAVYNSPFGNDLTWAAAKVVIENEQLGMDDETDYLAISFSSNDAVGHIWGPDSQEILDITLRSDRLIAEMIGYLDERVGKDNYVLALSSDHGVCPIPEIQQKLGLKPGRVEVKLTLKELETYLARKYPVNGKWIDAATGAGLYINHQSLKHAGIEKKQMETEIAAWFKSKDYVKEVFTRTEIMSTAPLEGFGEPIRLCFHAERSGDVFPVLQPYWFLSTYKTGTTHGSPHEYDTHVPLLFYGSKVNAGVSRERVSPQLAAVGLAATIGGKLEHSTVQIPGDLFK
ncbi:MAG: alkaline phosphatase family protein [Planctomycetia bacterium]|nr:alkaline phosphatase family protein [Planctomycetia bacterium]